MEIYYEDLMENFNNNKLREKLMQLVNNHNIIVVKGLNSAQRHKIYRNMYYPLKFEKVILNDDNKENTDIRIYNSKIKQKEKKIVKNVDKLEEKEETNKTNKTDKEEEYILEDSDKSDNENQTENETEYETEYETETDVDSYLTEEDEQLVRLEDIGSQILEIVVNNEKNIDKTRNRVNLVILFNIIGWIILCGLDPVRLIHIKTIECEAF
jgi:hypothetical protein